MGAEADGAPPLQKGSGMGTEKGARKEKVQVTWEDF